MRKPHIDGVRFLLFMMVFSAHQFGYIAQYLDYSLCAFFVMSGFVVTSVLLADNEPKLSQKIKAFYLRRVLRVFPAYYLVITLLIIFGGVTYPLSYIFHGVNIKLFLLSISPDQVEFHQWLIANWRKQSLQMWTLGVEEQFYLIYPLLLLLTPPKRRIQVLLLVIAGSILTRLWLAGSSATSFYGALLPISMEYLVWGGIFALLTAERKLLWLPPFPTAVASVATVVLLVYIEAHTATHDSLQFRPTAFQTPIAFLLALFIWSVWNIDPSHPLTRVLSFGPIAYLGSITFGMYLWHLMSWDIYTFLRGRPAPAFSLELFFGTLAVTILISMATWHFVEKPVNSLRKYVGRSRAPDVKRLPSRGEVMAG